MIIFIIDYPDYSNYCTYLCRFVSNRASWNKSGLAKTVDDLGESFRPTLQAAWLAFIKKTYPVDQPGQPVVGASSGAFFVQDDD